jgi:hypothetical protein
MAIGAIYKPQAANEPKANTESTPKPAEAVVQPPANNGQETTVVANTATTPTDDLLSRVTQFEIEQNITTKTPEEVDAELFNDKEFRQEIERTKSTNPELAKHMELLRKSAMTGINSKMQSIAEMRKRLEAVEQSKATSADYKFKAQSIDELLNNPNFMAEAKAKLEQSNSALANDQVLPDETKSYIQSLESKLKTIEDGLNQRQSQEANLEWTRQHEALSSKYRNYDRTKIDEVANGLITGKVKATPEYIYKVVHHDENVRKAYELGRKEGAKILDGKRQLNNSIDSVNAVQLDAVKQEKEESNLNFMQKIIAHRLAGGTK